MLHELVLLGCHSQFASYPYTFASYSHSCKILQPYVASTVRMHSDATFFSIGASLMKTFIKNQCLLTNSVFFINNCRFGRMRRIHVNQPFSENILAALMLILWLQLSFINLV